MKSISIIGGTGPEGRGLGLRFALAGHPVILGSRDASRASEAAELLLTGDPQLEITGLGNIEAAQMADWVVLSVPYDGLKVTAQNLSPVLKGKIVISVIAPLVFEKGIAHGLGVPEGSAAELTALMLPDSKVVSAFHNLSAHDLLDPNHEMTGDVVVCSEFEDAKHQVSDLINSIPSLRSIDGGSLANSRYVENLTALLININRRYGARTSIQFLGI